MTSTYDVEDIHVIEFDKLNKYKYFPLVTASGMIVRGALYPFSLIKTRLQIQRQGDIYNGTFDAFKKISKHEGYRGLYRGFWVSNLFVLSQISYIGTFEYVRHLLAEKTRMSNDNLRAFFAGGCASLISQTFLVPVDIVSQHMQMYGMISTVCNNETGKVEFSKLTAKKAISDVYTNYGLRGFYRGYFASIIVYAPNSATWWFSYQTYYGGLISIAPEWVPRLAVQCISAPMAGVTGAILYTSLDAIRARVQVKNMKFFETAQQLWREERFGIFFKGVSARMIQSSIYSFVIIFPYEIIKRLSIKDEYGHLIKW